MADDFSMDISGIPELQRALKGIGTSIAKLDNGLKDTGDFLTDFYSGQVFASRGGAIGESWPSLSDGYAAYKARKWPGRPPLIRTGEMQQSFRSDLALDGLHIHNLAKHFKYHQSGKPRTKIPRRMMMKLTSTLRRDVVNIIDRQLGNELRSNT